MGASAAVGTGGEYGDWALLGFISVVILVGNITQLHLVDVVCHCGINLISVC